MWEAKGAVMRQLNQQFAENSSNSVDGLKVTFSEPKWVLILPSQDQPHIEVVAEAATQEKADSLVEEYTQLIRNLQQ